MARIFLSQINRSSLLYEFLSQVALKILFCTGVKVKDTPLMPQGLVDCLSLFDGMLAICGMTVTIVSVVII